jgi:acyl-coenzyme A synthetase/AMP-(fatty) acid ligase
MNVATKCPCTPGEIQIPGHNVLTVRNIRGRYNVYSREVEEVLHKHPAVAEVGIPDYLLGEQVGAAVALLPGTHWQPMTSCSRRCNDI